MILRALKRLRGVLSEEAFVRAYERRQAVRPTEGNRTITTMLLTGFLAFLLLSTMLTLVWQRTDLNYLKTLSGVAVFPDDALSWTVRRAPAACAGRGSCTAGEWRAAPVVYRGPKLSGFDFAGAKAKGAMTAGEVIVLSTEVPRSLWATLAPADDPPPGLVLALPALHFAAARVYVEDEPVARLLEGQAVAIAVEPGTAPAAPLRVDLVLQPRPGQTTMVDTSRTSDVVFMAEAVRYQQYTDLVAGRVSGQGQRLADVSRVVLSIFALLLFIFVDSSPECLGLATFMSIKALAAALSQGWLPDLWSAGELGHDLRAFLSCFGDIMELFFFMQLARVALPGIRSWLLRGAALAAVYAALLHGNLAAFGIDWSEEIWRWRTVGIGAACFVVAAIGAQVCLRRRLYARALAMLVAASGALIQIVYPLAKLVPALAPAGVFQSVCAVWDTHTPYIFTLSAFINLSTLERRVRALYSELVQTRETERDRAVTQTIRHAYLPVPALPGGLAVAVNDGGADGSGAGHAKDACYVHWQADAGRLALIVHGFAGKGLAPALKGSACAALGSAVWEERDEASAAGRFARYDRRIRTFMARAYEGQESAAFVGAELELKEGRRRLTLFRADGTLPLMVWPSADLAGWRVEVVPLVSRQALEMLLGSPCFLVLTNTTLRLGVRGVRDLVRYLETRLAQAGADLDVQALRAMVATYVEFKGDGRTLIVLGVPRAEVNDVGTRDPSAARRSFG